MSLDAAALRARGLRGLRVVGDVHGDARGFAAAAAGAEAQGLFLVQLGDLTDGGPDAPGALRSMLGLLDRGVGLFLLGNHDHKLRRALAGHPLKGGQEGWAETLAQIDAAPDGTALRARTEAAILAAPAWLRLGPLLFVHGAFHPVMLIEPSPPHAALQRPKGALARALYGEVTGQRDPAGYPERNLGWVDSIPAGITVLCGHDRRSADSRPWRVEGRRGGVAMFLDTGAGKGGHLSWLDLPLPA